VGVKSQGKKQVWLSPFSRLSGKPRLIMARKKVGEIRGSKKDGFFIEKPEKMLPECLRVAKEWMVVQDSFRVLAQKQDPGSFSGAHLISILSPVSM
jgi:hypothetical protein